MDYNRHYTLLIKRAKSRSIGDYIERHHITPRCVGGSDNKENIVLLTPEEHYVAHQLLIKIYPNNDSLVYAANMMTVASSGQVRNNKRYGWLKRKYISVCRKRTGKKNSQFGTRWIHNTEIESSKKISVTDELPTGWQEGRVINFNKPAVQKPDKIGRLHKSTWQDRAAYWRTVFEIVLQSGCSSLREFAKLDQRYGTAQAIGQGLKKYVPESCDFIVSKKGIRTDTQAAKGVDCKSTAKAS